MRNLRILAALTGLTAIHSASAIDITISDPHDDKNFAGANVGPSGLENNTTQYNAIADQSWDLEAFNLTGSSLAISGGFNFLTGVGNGSTALFPLGDIFIYLGDDEPYTVPNSADHDGPWGGRDNWDYAIRFNRNSDGNVVNSQGGIGYSIVANGNQVINYTGGASALNSGLPWQLTGTYQLSGSAIYSTWSDGEGWHNSISGLDIGSVTDGQSFYLHTALKCGNDVLWGRSSVPDSGAALGLFGLGVGALGFLRRRLN